MALAWPFAGARALEKALYSPAELAGFAFHTLAGFAPDFDVWIAKKEHLRNLPAVKMLEGRRKIKERLQNGYYYYNPDFDLIYVDVRVKAKASHYFVRSQVPGTTTAVTIELVGVPGDDTGYFFPFEIGDTWIAVVAKDLHKLTSMNLKPQEYKDFAKKLSLDRYGNTKTKYANLTIGLRPVSVDTSAPIQLQGIEMWLMLAEPVHIEMWTPYGQNRDYIWEYRAPGFTPRPELELRSLYTDE